MTSYMHRSLARWFHNNVHVTPPSPELMRKHVPRMQPCGWGRGRKNTQLGVGASAWPIMVALHRPFFPSGPRMGFTLKVTISSVPVKRQPQYFLLCREYRVRARLRGLAHNQAGEGPWSLESVHLEDNRHFLVTFYIPAA